jgi:hypothetical protein
VKTAGRGGMARELTALNVDNYRWVTRPRSGFIVGVILLMISVPAMIIAVLSYFLTARLLEPIALGGTILSLTLVVIYLITLWEPASAHDQSKKDD